ncbi:hypothetical protein BLNAU_19538 [Blattamonas nauphoetae]|uniref:Uncharacterized protein n=1 Tax=Blattamonas nauphoetae TaxID=2049346 RepID=A0ABQ9X1I2_9EUKA|nr:hypothetical protein BLNAU_19538 [Blattamonas nauphoetae]
MRTILHYVVVVPLERRIKRNHDPQHGNLAVCAEQSQSVSTTRSDKHSQHLSRAVRSCIARDANAGFIVMPDPSEGAKRSNNLSAVSLRSSLLTVSAVSSCFSQHKRRGRRSGSDEHERWLTWSEEAGIGVLRIDVAVVERRVGTKVGIRETERVGSSRRRWCPLRINTETILQCVAQDIQSSISVFSLHVEMFWENPEESIHPPLCLPHLSPNSAEEGVWDAGTVPSIEGIAKIPWATGLHLPIILPVRCDAFPTLPATVMSRSVIIDLSECEFSFKRVEKGKSIESVKSGAHEDVTSLTRQVKRSEAGVDHAGTFLATAVIHPNWVMQESETMEELEKHESKLEFLRQNENAQFPTNRIAPPCHRPAAVAEHSINEQARTVNDPTSFHQSAPPCSEVVAEVHQ